MSDQPIDYPSYPGIVKAVIDDGALRLYRRGRWGFLRQDVYHPAGEWLTLYWHPSGRVQVTTRARSVLAGVVSTREKDK